MTVIIVSDHHTTRSFGASAVRNSAILCDSALNLDAKHNKRRDTEDRRVYESLRDEVSLKSDRELLKP